MYRKIIHKIKSNNLKYCIVGLGYVGLPLALRLIRAKCNIHGYDIDKNKTRSLIKGKSYISNIKSKELKYFKGSKDKLFNNIKKLEEMDVIFVCLPTPLNSDKSPDMSYLNSFFKKIKFFKKKYQTIILESTVYPGASQDIIKKYNLTKKLNKKELYFVYSPERENPGMKSFSYKTTPKVVSGYNKDSLIIGINIYKKFVNRVVETSSLSNAEATKLLENLFRSVNIGLINEFKIICEKLNLNIYEIIKSASTKNFGFMKFLPGPGLGGHCIPIDPYYLNWASMKKGYTAQFIKTSGDINSKMPMRIVNKISNILKKKKSKKSNLKILLIGIAYKKNIDDDRETPGYEIIYQLQKRKYKVNYYDPYIPMIKSGRKFKDKIKLKSIKISQKNLRNHDAILIVTDHDKINYNYILKNSNLIFDSRGVYRDHYDNEKIFSV